MASKSAVHRNLARVRVRGRTSRRENMAESPKSDVASTGSGEKTGCENPPVLLHVPVPVLSWCPALIPVEKSSSSRSSGTSREKRRSASEGHGSRQVPSHSSSETISSPTSPTSPISPVPTANAADFLPGFYLPRYGQEVTKDFQPTVGAYRVYVEPVFRPSLSVTYPTHAMAATPAGERS